MESKQQHEVKITAGGFFALKPMNPILKIRNGAQGLD